MNPIENELLRTIAPNDLQIKRKQRFRGFCLSVDRSSFAPTDLSIILCLYQNLKSIYRCWLDCNKDCETNRVVLKVKSLDVNEILKDLSELGYQSFHSCSESAANQLRVALHDIRGGCLNALLGIYQFAELSGFDQDKIQRIVYLARDHTKIMRNVVRDLDPELREEDEKDQVHHIDHFTEKLKDYNFEFQNLKLSIHLECEYRGYISNCCLETSSLDRVVYNFINNCAKYSSNHQAFLYIFQINEDVIRWVIQNPISEEHKQWLMKFDDFNQIFSPNKTFQGQGYGLSTCTEIICNSFGLRSHDQAIEEGYIGAKLVEDSFYSWFHWATLKPQIS